MKDVMLWAGAGQIGSSAAPLFALNPGFAKKMLKLGYIRATGKMLTGNPHRSPKLYTFDEEAYKTAKKIGMRLEF